MSQNFDWMFGLGNDGLGRGEVLVALQSLLTLEKGTIASNFQSNEPRVKFIRLSIP